MEITQISLKIDTKLIEQIKKDASNEKRSMNKQIEYMLSKYYEFKNLAK